MMMALREFVIKDEDFSVLLEAFKPVPYMVIGGVAPRSQQENANAAWVVLGKKMGFDGMSVLPSGKGDKVILAEPVDPAGKDAQ
jgi:hypothetical protein